MAGIQAPYGDIYFPQTSSLDRASQQLHAEEQQRQAMGYKDWLTTQQELQKQFANLRSPDVPDAVQKYQEWKQLAGALHFDQRLQHDPVRYNQTMQEATQKLGELQGLINGSAELKDNFKSISQARLTNPDNFDDNAGTMMQQDINTPTLKLVQNGWTPDRYAYGGANYNFSNDIKNATGQSKVLYSGDEQLSKDQTYYAQKGFSVANNPFQFHDNLMTSLTTKKSDKAAKIQYQNNYTPEQKQQAQDAFNNLPDSYFEGYGIDKKDVPALKATLNQANGKTDAEKWSILQSQLYAVSNPPKIADTKTRPNEAFKMAYDRQTQEIMEGIRQGNRKALKDYSEWYKTKDAAAQGQFVDEYYNSLWKEAQGQPRDYTDPKLGTFKTYEIRASPEIKKIFAVPNGSGGYINPDRVRFMPNGDPLPIFFKYQTNKDGSVTKILTKDGKGVVDTELTIPMPKQEFKIRTGKQLLGQKEANNEVIGDDDGTEESGGYRIRTTTPNSSGIKWK